MDFFALTVSRSIRSLYLRAFHNPGPDYSPRLKREVKFRLYHFEGHWRRCQGAERLFQVPGDDSHDQQIMNPAIGECWQQAFNRRANKRPPSHHEAGRWANAAFGPNRTAHHARAGAIAGLALHDHRAAPHLVARARADVAANNDCATRHAKVRESVRAANREGAKVFQALYDRSIDFGGHPNERAVTGSMSLDQTGPSSNYQLLLLQGDGLPLDHALKSAAQAGVCALDILGDVFAARYELLGVRAKMAALKSGL